jgi:putative ABC transport system substrate-binding protein
MKIELETLNVSDLTALENAFAGIRKSRTQALLVLPDAMFWGHRRAIVDLAAKTRVPAMYWSRDYIDVGGLVSYAPSLPALARRAAAYVDKILKGTRPADLPVEDPSTFELIINLATARALGLTVPPSLLLRADQVIE